MEETINFDELNLSFLPEPIKFNHESEGLNAVFGIENEKVKAFTTNVLEQTAKYIFNILHNEDEENEDPQLNFAVFLDIIGGNSSTVEELIYNLYGSTGFWKRSLIDQDSQNLISYLIFKENFIDSINILRATELKFLDIKTFEADPERESASLAEVFKLSKKQYFKILNKLDKCTDFFNSLEDNKSKKHSHLFFLWLNQAENFQELYFIATLFGGCTSIVLNESSPNFFHKILKYETSKK